MSTKLNIMINNFPHPLSVVPKHCHKTVKNALSIELDNYTSFRKRSRFKIVRPGSFEVVLNLQN